MLCNAKTMAWYKRRNWGLIRIANKMDFDIATGVLIDKAVRFLWLVDDKS